jgi:hypothetical protein
MGGFPVSALEGAMRGILSRHPAPSAARLALAGELLLIVTILLMLGSAQTLDRTLCAIAGTITLLAFAAFLLAIVGDRTRHPGRRRDLSPNAERLS